MKTFVSLILEIESLRLKCWHGWALVSILFGVFMSLHDGEQRQEKKRASLPIKALSLLMRDPFFQSSHPLTPPQ